MLTNQLKEFIKGEIANDEKTLQKYSRDASLFEVKPETVVFPKDSEDIKKLVQFISRRKSALGLPEFALLSITARCGGTDMTGGDLGESIVIDFTKHFNKIYEVDSYGDGGGYARAQPGVFYRDFEKETLKKNLLLPSYPASREICAVGGMVANNAGGEKTLAYGKTEDYILELKAVLSDGNEYILKPLNREELEKKLKETNFEGEIYRKISKLVFDNQELLQKAKPKVSKNSAGYYLWNVWDGNKFDLTKLFAGSQGTLGIITEITFRLITPKKYSRLAVLFLKDLKPLVGVAETVMRFKPESFESFDSHTLKLALKFLPSFIKSLKQNILKLVWQFLPEFWMFLTGGMPELALLAEFTGDDEKEIISRLDDLRKELKPFPIKFHIAKNEAEAKKYWTIRRESFNLLRKSIKGKRTAPFIDDFIVQVEKLPEFFPKLNKILDSYGNFTYTIAGHIGNGNFHIIPLMDLADSKNREIIKELSDKVYDLVLEFGGSITAEHNDGLIRSPYLKKMYGGEVYKLFEETKRIFDLQNIFNPGKKVGANLSYALEHLVKS